MNFSFLNPSYLMLLFVIPAIVFFHFFNIRNLRGKAVRFANYEAIARIRGIDLYSKNILILVINILIVISLVFSLAGFTIHMPMRASSFSYVIAIDSSESMGATDMIPDRFSAAKETAKDFIDSLPLGARVAVISFAGSTKIESEISANKEFLKNSINGIMLTNIGGTDLLEAVTIGSFVLRNETNKAIIILSDGQTNVNSADDVIKYGLKESITLHTIGIGTVAGGNTSFGLSKLDEKNLQAISYGTNGKYFNAADKEEILRSFLSIIPLTDKIAAIDLSFYLIVLTIILFIISQFIGQISKVTI